MARFFSFKNTNTPGSNPPPLQWKNGPDYFPAGMSFTSTVTLSDSETWTGFPSGSNCCMTFESKKAFSSKASHAKTLYAPGVIPRIVKCPMESVRPSLLPFPPGRQCLQSRPLMPVPAVESKSASAAEQAVMPGQHRVSSESSCWHFQPA
jgi:hypothetical protein